MRKSPRPIITKFPDLDGKDPEDCDKKLNNRLQQMKEYEILQEQSFS